MTGFLTWLKTALGGRTELAHALLAAAIAIPFAGTAMAVPAPHNVWLLVTGFVVAVVWFLSRETRDAERRLLARLASRGERASVWTVGPRAAGYALGVRDFLYPAMTAAAALMAGLLLIV